MEYIVFSLPRPARDDALSRSRALAYKPPVVEAEAISPGDVLLGKYRVERVLGRGGMGVVVAARHLHLGELHAIKLLGADAERVPDAVARFLREARAAARLRSEHVARVHDVGHLDTGMPYMVMEHLTGLDLQEHLRMRKRLPLDEAIALLLQACDAVAEAHAIGIVHRDLKPSNLFLTRRRDGTPCLKVLDFGLAKEISVEGAELTKSGTTLGSPLYMSPEQIARTKGVDARTDIWSLGVVLHKLVTGQLPFQGDTLLELMIGVGEVTPRRPSEVCGELPSWIDDVVLRCLEKHPEDRFPTIDDLAAALRGSSSGDRYGSR
jgi:serine/threonine protein kinase